MQETLVQRGESNYARHLSCGRVTHAGLKDRAGLYYARGFGLTISPSQAHKLTKVNEFVSNIPIMLL